MTLLHDIITTRQHIITQYIISWRKYYLLVFRVLCTIYTFIKRANYLLFIYALCSTCSITSLFWVKIVEILQAYLNFCTCKFTLKGAERSQIQNIYFLYISSLHQCSIVNLSFQILSIESLSAIGCIVLKVYEVKSGIINCRGANSFAVSSTWKYT